eukprot:RCo046431
MWENAEPYRFHPPPPLNDLQKEQLRVSACGFLFAMSAELGMKNYNVVCSATVFVHRFFAKYGFHEEDHFVVACACMVLSGKVEESVLDIQFVATYASGHVPQLSAVPLLSLCKTIEDTELKVLAAIDFELWLQHPHLFVKRFTRAKAQGAVPEEARVFLQVGQIAWNFCQDSLLLPLRLEHKPYAIAAAALFLASEVLSQTFPLGIFNEVARCVTAEEERVFTAVTAEEVALIAELILKLYRWLLVTS